MKSTTAFLNFLIFFVPVISCAQKIKTDSVIHSGYNKASIKNFALPAAFIVYGLVSLENDGLKSLNLSTKNEVREDLPYFRSNLDNYTQFVPAISALGLNALGIKGEHHLKDASILYAGTVAINSAIVLSVKKITHIMRPDSSGYTSFPSGHTATAFASAEFLRREYGRKYPWLPVAGYAVAIGTGAYRMLNNKHWFSDVVAGAGIGIASANLSYWLFNKVKTKANTHSTFYYPVIQSGSYGIGLIKIF